MITRLRQAWRALAGEQRLAVACAFALFVTMFLPWYGKDVSALVDGRLQQRSSSMSAWGAFSFVEAAVLLVAAGVVALFFARAEGRRFHLPGGDGVVTLVAGAWVCVLIFIRWFDKPDAGGGGPVSATVGVSWGIFVAFLAGLALAYAGFRIREAHIREPGDPGAPARRRRRGPGPRPPRTPRPDATTVVRQPPAETPRVSRGPLPPDPHGEPTSIARRPEIDGGTQLSFDEQE